MNTRIRYTSPVLKEIMNEFKKNPVISTEVIEPEQVTTKEHIKELQELLVQTCIDYINEHGLKDIYEVRFNADDLQHSAEAGSWQSCTDSYICVNGYKPWKHTRKDGTEFIGSGETYVIGERF